MENPYKTREGKLVNTGEGKPAKNPGRITRTNPSGKLVKTPGKQPDKHEKGKLNENPGRKSSIKTSLRSSQTLNMRKVD